MEKSLCKWDNECFVCSLDANIEELFKSEQTKWIIEEIIAEFALAAKLDGVELDEEEITNYVVDISKN